MKPTPELIDALFREEVLRARAMTPEERMIASVELFDLSLQLVTDRVRGEHPDADAATIADLVEQRFDIFRSMETGD